MNWTIWMHLAAIQSLYRIEQGTAANVTDAIRHLSRNPRPPDAEPVVERPGVYTIEAAGYIIGYQVNEAKKEINVVWIE